MRIKALAFVLSVFVLGVAGVMWGPVRAEDAAAPDVAGRGMDLFGRHCAVCHGTAGMGDGPASYLVYPRPRDFTRSEYRLITTTNGVPTDEDLYRVISNGMPGSAMPPHDRLPEADRRLLAKVVRSLWQQGLRQKYKAEGVEQGEIDTYVSEDTTPGAAVPLAGEAEPNTAILARGRILYFQACASCHGAEGRGDTNQKLIDSLGDPAPARDFTKGIFKGGSTGADIYTRLRAGMKGTAMPTFNEGSLAREDAWAIVHYCRSLVPPGAQMRVAQTCKDLRVKRVAQIPADDAAWNALPGEYIALMPLWWRDQRVEGVLVQMAHDEERIAVRLQWEDMTQNSSVLRPQDFQDGAALQLTDAQDPPFFGMGDKTAAVTIWSWKASWQEDLGGFRDIEAIYPNLNLDTYPSQKDLPYGERPAPDKVGAQHHDPTYLSGWGAGNPVSEPERKSAVEVLEAKGLGSSTNAGPGTQSVQGLAKWDRNVWSLVIVTPKPPAMGSKPHHIAFAIWDGAQSDRNGQKSVSIWHRLALE